MVRDQGLETINIIASNPTGDEDFACAEYIEDLILDSRLMDIEQIKSRIINSHAARKFFDKNNTAFNADDIHMCIKEIDTSFVMQVDATSADPAIFAIPCTNYPDKENFKDLLFPNSPT